MGITHIALCVIILDDVAVLSSLFLVSPDLVDHYKILFPNKGPV